ncbi:MULTISPECIES: alpha/beta fold hydrolase [Pseudonocardia]|uniref:Carboxylesterase A n=2 Tax=Pseudonocardia TaxID=1847 RepID=A0A1Y2MLW2_PSEAH|nr:MULTISPECIES: alpha/beta fold hydrolase [Pseudonocardia]OSY36230.1 Carboxylesterase A precursor [Pseudonocardia autotrophica]TDN73038.1 alpha/beta hydrolase family protein [Pseudonocardia autotrophica]BBG03756.1 alpha/beta hydrolase [Pseudonocardia autotrophica]GEC26636.1 alpha/beta hydrolase [Pseudonocardia saturnea]
MFGARSMLPVLGLASLLLVGACAAPARPPAPPEPADTALAQFHAQEVVFGPCEPYASSATDEALYGSGRFDCARVQVPLDYAEPDGPRGEVALLRAKARGEKIGSLLVNPGGPGGSGMNLVASLGASWDTGPVGERFDVIGFDPRGVGASTPRVTCWTDAEIDRGVPPGPYRFDVPDERSARDIAQRCVQNTPGGVEALTSVGSVNVVQDMDVLRAALGDEKLSYLGFSYGSELGAMYAEAFPQNLRAMVVDGAVHPELSEPDFRLTQFTAWQETFERMAALCATGPDCALGTDPAQATERFQDLVRPLQDRPLSTADGRELTYDDTIEAVTLMQFAEAQWPVVVRALDELARGRGEPMLALRDLAVGRGPDGSYGGSLDIDANLATRCMDNPRRTAEEHTELGRQAFAAAPFLDPGRPLDRAHYECEAWPEPVDRDLPWLGGVGGVDGELPPTLTVSVTGDPGTPHEGGIAMARLLGGSLLTVEGVQHGISLLGQSECVDEIVGGHLIDLRTPPADARCSL